jgi:hypothetical protein
VELAGEVTDGRLVAGRDVGIPVAMVLDGGGVLELK